MFRKRRTPVKRYRPRYGSKWQRMRSYNSTIKLLADELEKDESEVKSMSIPEIHEARGITETDPTPQMIARVNSSLLIKRGIRTKAQTEAQLLRIDKLLEE